MIAYGTVCVFLAQVRSCISKVLNWSTNNRRLTQSLIGTLIWPCMKPLSCVIVPLSGLV
jgi:hypothetical protein